jgi:hypothetical protein
MAPLKYPLKTATDICVPYPEDKRQYCEICGITAKSKNALAGHIGAKHRVKFEDYLVRYYMNEQHPKCPVCNENTRYLRGDYAFKKYCVEHANESRKEWSENKGFGNNGFDHNWRSGQTKETNESIARQSEKISGINNPSFLSEQQYKDKIVYLQQNNITLNLPYEQYLSNTQAVSANCNLCDRKIIKKFCNLINSPLCPSCSSGKSGEEQELYNFILSLNVAANRNCRDIIDREIDIYIPSKQFAIEYNGLYWHTEDKVGQKYHSEKSMACSAKNIKMFHIFSDEWKNKRSIVESMIRHRLNISENIIYASKCSVKETESNKVLSDFFDKTHISGHTNFTKGFYLQKDGEIVCALTLRTAFHKKYENMIEIARFSSKLNTSVVGGFSRLLKYAKIWAKQNGYLKIFTYADLRFGEGRVYEKNGFQFLGKTRLDYWYTDGKSRFNRFQYRAQNGKTEKQVAEGAGVSKIYGCGSNTYEYLL